NVSPMELSLLPVIVKTYNDIYYNTQTTDDAVKFFENLGILPKTHICLRCESPM
ncbi:1429_t:CDS:1, partial [Cetraspora pellucida]